MKKLIAASVIVAAACAACSGEETPPEPTAVPTAAPSTSTAAPQGFTTGTDGTNLTAPSVVSGDSEESVKTASEAFVMGWANYRSAAQQPRQEWFDSWKAHATDSFIQRMRTEFNTMWSWTWNQEKQVMGAQVDGTIQVHLDGNTAVARVPVKRWVYGIDTPANEGEEQKKVYDLFLVLDPAKPALVNNTREVGDDEPFPPRNRA